MKGKYRLRFLVCGPPPSRPPPRNVRCKTRRREITIYFYIACRSWIIKEAKRFAPSATHGFSVTLVAPEGARREKISARLLGHVRQISPNARDGGYRRALSRIFYLRHAKRYIRAIFTPACAASFAFYRAATRYLEYTPGGCISHSALLCALRFVARRIYV